MFEHSPIEHLIEPALRIANAEHEDLANEVVQVVLVFQRVLGGLRVLPEIVEEENRV